MIRCNPALGAGEKPSPSKTAVATPLPNLEREQLENNLECEEALRVMQGNWYLQITRQNEGGEKSNLSPSSKDTPTEEGELTRGNVTRL